MDLIKIIITVVVAIVDTIIIYDWIKTGFAHMDSNIFTLSLFCLLMSDMILVLTYI